MSFISRFVAVIKSNGKVLRETQVNGTPTVYLPYFNEYLVELVNNHRVRCVAEVQIDGTDVLSGKQLIIEANSKVYLERFVVDGNLNHGKRFKFVPLSNSKVQNPYEPENGKIRVKFWKEVDTTHILPKYQYPYDNWEWPYYTPLYWESPFKYQSSGGVIPASMNYCCSSIQTLNASAINGAMASGGATVEGGSSNQKFSLGSIGTLESTYTELVLQILPAEQVRTVQNTKHIYCSSCGKRNAYKNNYCFFCGSQLEK